MYQDFKTKCCHINTMNIFSLSIDLYYIPFLNIFLSTLLCNIKYGSYLMYLDMHGTFSSNVCKKYFWPHKILLKLMLDTNYAYSKTNKLVNR